MGRDCETPRGVFRAGPVLISESLGNCGMASLIVQTSEKVTLIGAGPVKTGTLKDALTLAPYCIAVDGGTEMARKYGIQPEHVLGDLDSILQSTKRALDPTRTHHFSEQDTTDFDKALRSIRCPLIIGVGFLGGRLDHTVANASTLLKYADRNVILLSKREVMFHLPPEIKVDLAPGSRISVIPLRDVRARSTGLEWPLDAHFFAPGGMLGTSNRVTDGTVRIETLGEGLIAVAPRQALASVAEALTRSRQIT